jgi:hypothetical protein
MVVQTASRHHQTTAILQSPPWPKLQNNFVSKARRGEAGSKNFLSNFGCKRAPPTFFSKYHPILQEWLSHELKIKIKSLKLLVTTTTTKTATKTSFQKETM